MLFFYYQQSEFKTVKLLYFISSKIKKGQKQVSELIINLKTNYVNQFMFKVNLLRLIFRGLVYEYLGYLCNYYYICKVNCIVILTFK